MKTLLILVKEEFTKKDNILAAISCLVLSISIFFIMKVIGG
ncbi:hypothetical protein [Pareuzebyella sediminis]|nr:hypothetical protein [Pareuzebyella sediminis]